MRIIVNHLTRMQPGYICVAGIDLSTGKHVRPVVSYKLRTDLLRRYRGPFDMAAEIELGPTRYVGRAPELEDFYFESSRVRRIRDSAPDDFWQLLQENAQPTLSATFGADLTQRHHSCTVELGKGSASLGCLVPSSPPQLFLDDSQKIRVRLDDGTYHANLSLTDLRFYEPNHLTPRHALMEQVAQKIARGVPIILSVGLSRPWRKAGDTTERHWLQVNNIHLENDPTWKDCSEPYRR